MGRKILILIIMSINDVRIIHGYKICKVYGIESILSLLISQVIMLLFSNINVTTITRSVTIQKFI